jgi:hypothetical protein
LLVRAPNARQCAGQTEVLTPAHAWADLGLAEAFVPDRSYTFTQVLCAAHQIIHVQGAWVESGLPACPARDARDGALERPDMTGEPRPTEGVEPARLCLQRSEAHAVIHAERDSRFSSFPDTVLRRA